MTAERVDLREALQRISVLRTRWGRLFGLLWLLLAQPKLAVRAMASSLLHKRSAAGRAWWRLPRSQRIGVNVIGYVDGEFGLGVMARSVLADLERAGIPFRIVANEVRNHGFVRCRFHALSCAENFSVNLAVTTPDRWQIDALRLALEIDLCLPTIGYVAWELEGMPTGFVNNLRLFDEVWGISGFCAEQVCKSVAQKPLCLPIGIELPKDLASFDGAKHGLPTWPANDHFIVGFFFDAASFVERKNPMDVIRAFQAAFPKEAPQGFQRKPRLILKTHNTSLAKQQHHWQDVLEVASGDERIFILDAKLSTPETWSLMRILHCYVSLHRAEGLGLTVGEALAMGVPTVCTAYGGVVDYAHLPGFHGVGFKMTPIEAGQYLRADGLMWAKPNWLEAARKICAVYDQSAIN